MATSFSTGMGAAPPLGAPVVGLNGVAPQDPRILQAQQDELQLKALAAGNPLTNTPAVTATIDAASGANINGGTPIYDPSKGGWVYPNGSSAPAPQLQGWQPGADVNGNPIPANAYAPQGQSIPGAVGQAVAGPNGIAPVSKIPAALPDLSLGGGASAINTGAISAAGANSAALSAQYEAERQGFQPTAAPTAQAQQINGTSLAQQGAAIQAGQSTAAQIAQTLQAQQQAPVTAQQVQAALASRQGTMNAPQIDASLVSAQRGVSAQDVTAAQAGRTTLNPTQLAAPTTLAQAALAQHANIDPTQQAQFRAGQTGLISGLNGAISGQDPSVAAIMLRQETERNISNQYALAQGANGTGSGLALRQAMMNAGDMNQQSIGQQALLRAQEIATARGQLGGVLDQARGADVGLATNQAGLQQQAGLANQGALNTQSLTQGQMAQGVNLANAGFQNTASQTQAQLDAAQRAQNAQSLNTVGLANAGNQLQAGTTNAGLWQQSNLANQAAQNAAATQNAGNQLQAQTTNMTLAQQVQLANQASQNQVGLANAGNQLQAGTTNASLGQQVQLANAAAGNTTNQTNAQLAQASSLANASNQTGANTASAQLANQVALANAASQNQTASTNATLGTQAAVANAGNATTTNAQNITAKNDLATNALTGSGQAITGAVGAAQAQATAQQSANQLKAAEIGAAASTGAALLSDRRAKTDVRPGDLDVDAFLRDLKAYNFKYKDPTAPGAAPGQRTGIMVQDLERNRLGRSLVRETPAGKAIDVNQATGAALAALASLNARVSKVEAR
jgi:hypothetical protein